MKTDISFLPEEKQEELGYIVERITEELDPLIIILFGSYARNEWVEEYQVNTEYVSDYDILIITRQRTNPKQERREDRVLWDFKKDRTTEKASIIAHSLSYLNKKIEERQYFFYDIYREGIILFNRDNLEIASPKELSISKRKEKAENQFGEAYGWALQFYKHFKIAFDDNEYKVAAFQLHQSVENLYASILLTYTDYKPKLHDLEVLERKVINVDKDFLPIFLRETDFQKECFVKLKEAYVKARYDRNYTIQKEHLEYLGERVKFLQELTEKKCLEKIASFEEKGGD